MNNPLFDLTGRTALVTGSSRGLGRAIATGLAQAGARVVINGVDAERAEATAQALREAGFQADAAPFDVTDEAAVSPPSTPSTPRAWPSTSWSTTPASSCASRWSS